MFTITYTLPHTANEVHEYRILAEDENAARERFAFRQPKGSIVKVIEEPRV